MGIFTGLSAGPAFGQGAYYPVSTPGSPYGAFYTGTPITTDADLAYLQQVLQTIMPGADPTLTLQVPVPTVPVGAHPPTSAQYATAVNYAIRAIVGPTPPSGPTLATFVNKAISLRPSDRSLAISAMGQGVLDSGLSATDQVDALKNTVAALAAAQPVNVSANVALILAKAATGVDASIPQSIPQLVAIAAEIIPNDSSQIGALTASALSQLGVSTLSAANRKTVVLNSFIPTMLATAAANNNPVIIDALVTSFTNNYSLSLVTAAGPLTPLDQVLQASLASLPASNRFTVGSVATGALRSLGTTYASQIQTRMNTELAGSPALQSYANNVVNGFTATAGTYNGLVTGNPNADGVAAGAIARGATVVPTATVVQTALTLGTANPRNVIFATVSANSGLAVTITQAAVQPSFSPYGSATFGDIIDGAVSAVPKNEQVGPIVSALIAKTAANISSLPTTPVLNIVQGAITAAYNTGKDGAFSDIVSKAAGLTSSTSGLSAPMVTAAIQAINTATAPDTLRYPTSQDRPTYVAVVAALATDTNSSSRAAIRAATLGAGGTLATTANGDYVAAQNGSDMVEALRASAATKYTAVLKKLDDARLGTSPTRGAMADLYAATIAGSDILSAVLAAAIKQSTVSPDTLLEIANNASSQGSTATLKVVADVATYVKGNPNNLLNYLGAQIVTNSSLTKDIATAAAVVDPNHAHFVATAVGFNNPQGAAGTVASLFTVTQITNPQPFVLASTGNPTGARLTGVVDQPAAAAALVAGFSTGILEANIPQADRKTAFVNMVANAVTASIGQNNVYLLGPTNPFNNPGDGAQTFRQSNGTTWNGATPIKTGGVRTVGAAGAITGYMAQVVHLGDTSLLQTGESGTVTDSISAAVLRSAAINGSSYILEIAQAAAQAFGWVSGTNTGAAADVVALQIAQAMIPSGSLGGKTQADLQQAARFGLAESAAGRIGAGALGLNSTAPVDGFNKPIVAASGNSNSQFYTHRSATGTPVTDIFNL